MIERIKKSLEHVPPNFLKKMLGNCLWEGTSDSGIVALTFDDGPDPEVTPAVLDTFDELGGHGTFFMRGDAVKKHPHIARQVVERGHTIGNHSMTHRRMFIMKRRDILYELDEARRVISDATGAEPVWFRPPYGVFDFSCAKAVKKRGMTLVLWTVLSGDYDAGNSDREILETVTPFIRSGAIQVFHDTAQGVGTALPGIIRQIGAMAGEKDLRLGSIDELTVNGGMKIRNTHDV